MNQLTFKKNDTSYNEVPFWYWRKRKRESKYERKKE